MSEATQVVVSFTGAQMGVVKSELGVDMVAGLFTLA